MMKQACPVSIELVSRLLDLTKEMTLKECFVLDYAIIENMVINSDFEEGVRSLLI